MSRWRGGKGARSASPDVAVAAEQAHGEATSRADLLERILDATDEGVVHTDAAGEVLFVNRAARSILGFGPRRSSPGLESIGLRALASAAAGSGEDIVEERELHIPSRRTLSVRALPFGDGALVLISDVTKTRGAERVRRDFIANVSHELKTPVSSIALMAEQLSHAIREDRDAALRFASRIHDEADRLARMVVDLLDLSRIESEMPLDMTELDVSALIADALTRVDTLASSKRIQVDVEAPAAPLRMRGDAQQIVAALGNLLDNAVRYSPEGAVVAVEAVAGGGQLSITVRDEGPGIPTNEIGRIFERFYRVDKARARATGGTGLGLAIVKHVAERHGGRVAADSELGRGSRFTLIFPMEEEQS